MERQRRIMLLHFSLLTKRCPGFAFLLYGGKDEVGNENKTGITL